MINYTSHADISGDISISNAVFGLSINFNSSADVLPEANLTVFETAYGIAIVGLSIFEIQGDSYVYNNVRGLSVVKDGSVIIHGSLRCAYNSDCGIWVDYSGIGPWWGFGELLVEHNTGHGIISNNSSLTMYNKFVVRDNGGIGVNVIDGSLTFGSDTTIAGNDDGDLNLSFGAHASIGCDPDDIGSISCDDTVLIRGTVTCPP